MAVGNWSIRSKIAAMVSTPLVALTALWGFALTVTAGPALDLLRFRTLAEDVARPTEALVTELQRERRASLVFLAGRAPLPALDRQREQTDSAVAALRRLASRPAGREALGPHGRQRVAALLRALDGLPQGRARVVRRELDRLGASAQYTALVETALRLLPTVTHVGDDALARQARTLVDLARARELLAREDALVSAALAGGRFLGDETRTVSQLVGLRRMRYADAAAALPDSGRAAYRMLVALPEFGRLRSMEDLLVARARPGEPPPVDARHWEADCRAVAAAARAFEVDQAAAVAAEASDVATGIAVRLALAGLLGLVAVVATLVLSVRIGRTVVRRLHRLRDTARAVADDRLPDVVARLRRGDPVDIDAASPDPVDGTDEIGELAGAFAEVHRTAVRAAVDEARFRRGTAEVFRNIAHRSQTLLHRQLALLDRMERDTTDPDALADLFTIDHLATRLRRHAEDLVILAGATPSRGWRDPVPLVDVLRGAVSEVEEYARVDVQADPPAALVGRAVSDVIHLLAELVENAATFSPPRSRVRISVQPVPAGLAVEIEDRGLGMPAEALAEWNARLAVPPEFDPTASARLGLFVVARLAARHAIPVCLRPSPRGGVTAVVLLPAVLVVTDTAAVAAARSGGGRPRRPARWRPATGAGRAPVIPAPRASAEGTADAPPRSAAAREVAAAASGADPGVGAGGPDGPPMSPDGLPRRVRQASLAPQLRRPPTLHHGGSPGGPAGDGDPVDRRSPQAVRQMMRALQEQSRRGRAAAGSTGTARAATVAARHDGAEPAGGDAAAGSDGEGSRGGPAG